MAVTLDIREQFIEKGISCLWHLTHLGNVRSIMERGLLSYNGITGSNIPYSNIADPKVKRWRGFIEHTHGRSLYSYVPLYLVTHNPMLYRLQKEGRKWPLCWLEISLDIFTHEEYDVLVADGNASCKATECYPLRRGVDKLPWDVLSSESWTNYDDGKRKRCAEVLVYPKVEVQFIKAIYCYDRVSKELLKWCDKKVEIRRQLFF